MQFPPKEHELLQALGRNPDWHSLLSRLEAEQIKVLKANATLEILCRAQGAAQLIDSFRAASKPT